MRLLEKWGRMSGFRSYGLALMALSVLLLPAALILSGCGGGGGGPVSGAPQGGLPGVPTTASAAFLALLPAAQKGATYVGSQACAACHGPSGGMATSTSLKRMSGGSGPRQPHAFSLASLRGAAALPSSSAGRPSSSSGARPLQTTPTTPEMLPDLTTPFLQTIHAAQSVGCENCHGPGSAHVAAKGGTDNILTFPDILSAQVCAQCHATVHSDWQASAHHEVVGDALSTGVASGGVCLRCHSDQYRVQVVELGRPAGDLAQYATNVAVTASCATCHDPHHNTDNLTLSGKQAMLREALANTDPTPVGPGTSPASYSTLNQICARCHNGRGVDPSDAALQKGTVRPSMHDSPQFNMLAGFGGVDIGQPIVSTDHYEAPGQCVHCHMNEAAGGHSFTVKLDNCAPCHTPADAAARENAVKDEIESGLLALRSRLSRWSMATFNDPDLWDYTSLIQGADKMPPDQKLIPIEVKRARHNYYFVVRDDSFGVHNGKYARFLLDVANIQLNNLGVAAASVTMRGNGGLAILEADRRRAARADSIGPL